MKKVGSGIADVGLSLFALAGLVAILTSVAALPPSMSRYFVWAAVALLGLSVAALCLRRLRRAMWATGAAALSATASLLPMSARPLLVSTGSMEPTIPTGSTVLVREVPAEDLEVGDIANIQTDSMVMPVIHRVTHTETSASSDTTLIQMQGDANPRPDSGVYDVSTAEAYLFHIPSTLVTQSLDWISSPMGYTTLALLAPVVFFLVFWPWEERRQARRADGSNVAEKVQILLEAQTPARARRTRPTPRRRESAAEADAVFDDLLCVSMKSEEVDDYAPRHALV